MTGKISRDLVKQWELFSSQQQELNQSNPSQPGNTPSSLLPWEQGPAKTRGKMDQEGDLTDLDETIPGS